MAQLPIPAGNSVGEKGYVLISAGLGAAALIALLGLSVDIGHMYIVKNEAQAYVDAAAVDAGLQLDGTITGINRAVSVVNGSPNRWDFGTKSFTQTNVSFAQTLAGPWIENPNPATGYTMVKVQTSANVGLYFLPGAVNRNSTSIVALAVAGQVPKTKFKEGLFPFSPFAHNTVGPNFGLQRGQQYTLRWAANPRLTGGNPNVCMGDRLQTMVNLAQAQGGEERGFIEQTSASVIRATVTDDYQSVTRTIGDLVDMTGGTKQTILDALNERINQDTDVTSSNYQAYHGNGRRVVAVPINDGGTPPGSNNRIVAIAGFFLLRTGEYGNGGGQAWCAEYIGPWVQGSRHGGAGTDRAYVVRLVQ
jgi:hypothetical protein